MLLYPAVLILKVSFLQYAFSLRKAQMEAILFFWKKILKVNSSESAILFNLKTEQLCWKIF